jgi:hypothetical protein
MTLRPIGRCSAYYARERIGGVIFELAFPLFSFSEIQQTLQIDTALQPPGNDINSASDLQVLIIKPSYTWDQSHLHVAQHLHNR